MTILSVYWSPHHMRVREDDPNSDLAYIRALQPAWIRIHQPTATAIYHAQRAAPNAKIMLRSWDIDDHNGDRKREMYADPKGAARLHMAMWETKLIELENELRVNGWAYDKTKWYMGLVNEPDPAYVSQVVTYNLEAIAIGDACGFYLGVVVSSVGTFSKPSENPHGWALCKPLEQPINAGGHILIAHEYWQPEGPNYGEDGGNLAWRHQHIPLNVPILIGESGANGYIYGRYSKDDDSGWQKTVKDPNVYAAQVKEYIEGCDERVQGVCLYMTDYHSDQWQSFDTQPAMHQLLAIKDARPLKASPFAATPPVTTHLPSVGTGTQPDDRWQRSRAFIQKWEGGWADHPADPGGATNKGITIGTFIRWRTERGLPVPTKEDLRAITDEEADQIYKEWYWLPSGADKLPWPMCLAVFDLAVNGGTGRSEQALNEAGHDFLRYMAWRIDWYTRISNFEHFGKAWIRRCADLMREAAQ